MGLRDCDMKETMASASVLERRAVAGESPLHEAWRLLAVSQVGRDT